MSNALPPAAVAALHAGNKIEAIKIVRENGVPGLKEAKDCIERYLLEHPELQRQLNARRSGWARTLSWWFMFAVAMAAILRFWPTT